MYNITQNSVLIFVIFVLFSASTRPIRTSAKKALDHFKEWVNIGTKRKYESEEDSDADDPKPKKQDTQDLTNLFKKKILGNSNSKTPVLVANSKGVVRVDPEQVPNLSSGSFLPYLLIFAN